MCGLVGIINKDQKTVDKVTLKSMAEKISHRGPDDEGELIDGNIGLYHKRLSVIDLITGRQPMTSGPISIIFNGEILLSGTSRELVNNEKAREVYLGDRFTNPFENEKYKENY